MKRAFLTSVLILGGLVSGACAAHVGYVRMAPPAPRVERYGYAPRAGYIWVDGYWRWSGGRYAWAPGYWARPPRGHSAWVSGSWDSTPRGYRWRRGHWR